MDEKNDQMRTIHGLLTFPVNNSLEFGLEINTLGLILIGLALLLFLLGLESRSREKESQVHLKIIKIKKILIY